MHYTNFHAQFVFILLYIDIQMYFRTYKALNVLLWKKKYWRDGGKHAFCWHVRVVERLCFCLTLINIHIVYTIVTYIYVINIV